MPAEGRAQYVTKKATAVHVRALAERLTALARQGPGGRAAAVELLQTMDRDTAFSPAARAMVQDLLGTWGVATDHPIGLPANDTPYWLRGERLVANHQSNETLPQVADIVVIGAGLTGASAAYHLALEGASGIRADRRLMQLNDDHREGDEWRGAPTVAP